MKTIRTSNSIPIGVSVTLFAVALLAGLAGVFSYRSATELVAHGQHAVGQVVAIARPFGSSAPHPVFAFTAEDGHRYRVVSDTYSVFAPHVVGERVGLIYAAGEPQKARIEEWSSLYFTTAVFAVFTAVPLIFSIGALITRREAAKGAEPYIRIEGREIHVDLSSDRGRWGIPKGRRLRFVLWSCALLSLPIVSILFGDRVIVIVATGMALGVEALLLLVSALPNQPKIVEAMRITNFYSRAYLWFQGVFWTLLISFVVWRLWTQLDR